MRTRRILLPFAALGSTAVFVFACVHMPTYAPQNPAVKNEMHSGRYRDAVSDYRDKLFDAAARVWATALGLPALC